MNSLTTRLSNASAKMFLMHAFYGFGATVSPLISTQFVKHVPRFYLYFCVSVGLALTTVIVLAIVFQGRTEDQIVGRRQPDPVTGNRIGQDTSSRAGMGTVAETPGEKDERPVHSGGSGGKMKAIMATPVVHYMAFYTMIYVSSRLSSSPFELGCAGCSPDRLDRSE